MTTTQSPLYLAAMTLTMSHLREAYTLAGGGYHDTPEESQARLDGIGVELRGAMDLMTSCVPDLDELRRCSDPRLAQIIIERLGAAGVTRSQISATRPEESNG